MATDTCRPLWSDGGNGLRAMRGRAVVSRRCKRSGLAVVAMVALATAACDPPPLSTAPSADVVSKTRVVGTPRVVDGDTLEIDGRPLTLWGVDAPEPRQACTLDDGSTWPCGAEAARALANRLGTGGVECEPRGRLDGESVALCRQDGEDLGAWLVARGFALDYPVTSRGHYRRRERAASRARLGVHRGGFEDPWVYRTRPDAR